jgi:hypothetical protein
MLKSLPPQTRRILGIDFFEGSAQAAIAQMRNGGLLVAPAAPALMDLDRNELSRIPSQCRSGPHRLRFHRIHLEIPPA